jgi:hypothetical protein
VSPPHDSRLDPRLIQVCDWCRRWKRDDGWGPLELDDTVPGLVSHSICPDCAERVLSGELLPDRRADDAQAERVLEEAGRITSALAELHPDLEDDEQPPPRV